MFVYDLWDEWLYNAMLRKSYDMWRSRGDASPKIGGEEVADAVLKGAFMGLHKRELTEDDDPGDHLLGEAARVLLAQAFNSPTWADVRTACRGKQSLAAIASAAILDTIVDIVEEKNREGNVNHGRARRSKAGGEVDSLDKLDKAQGERDKAEHEQAKIDALEGMKGEAQGARERNSLDAAQRKAQAKKDMHDKVADEAEKQGRAALDGVAREVEKKIGGVLRKVQSQINSAHDSMEKLAEAGVLDEGIDEIDDYDLDEADDPGEWDEEERDELIRDIGRGASLRATQKRDLEEMSTETLRRIRASSAALTASRSLVKLAEEIGRIKQVFRSAMKPAPIAGNPGTIEGVTYGNKISSLTSAGLATMASPRLRKLWRLNFVEENLPEREMWGPDMAGRGPIVLALDCSSSMEGTKFFWGKALSIALLSIAKEQERDFAFIGFDDKLVNKVIVPQGKADMNSLISVEQTPCNGGTSYQIWMEEAVKIIESRGAFAKADVIVITDGMPGESSWANSPERIASDMEYYKRQVRSSVAYGYMTQEKADKDTAEYERQLNLWGWWEEQRERLGFRVRGIFIQGGRSSSAISQDVLSKAREELAMLVRQYPDASTRGAYEAERIQANEHIIQVITAEIKAGVEVVAPITPVMLTAASQWAHAEHAKYDTTDYAKPDYKLARQYQSRAWATGNLITAATVMARTCDTWADVSQVADPEATAAVESEIARMVE